MNRFTLVATVALTLSSCGKQFSSAYFNLLDRNKLHINEFDFEHLSAKTKIKYSDNDNSLGGTANIRMKKDSLIWISFSPALGIEVARALITRDSLFLIDRMNKAYYAFSYDSLSRRFHFDLNFRILQEAIVGNLAYPRTAADELTKDEHFYTLRQQVDSYQVDNFIGTKTMKVERVVVRDASALNTLSITYGQFLLLEGKAFPFRSLVSLSYIKADQVKTTQVAFEHSKAQLEGKELKFPFNVPNRYDTQNR